MSLPRWKRMQIVGEIRNPWWIYRTEKFELPTGKRGEYHFVHTNGSSLTIPVLNDGRLALVRQYRYLCDRESLEFPCGSVKDGSSYEETARQELAEEAGYSAGNLTVIGEFNPYNGVTDEMCRVFHATELSAVQVPPDETEQFERVTLAPRDIESGILSGEIWDGMTLAAWAIARKRFAA